MRMMFCHLTGSLRGRTQYFNTDSISFGVGEKCGIVFDSVEDAAVCPVHAELTVEDHTPTIRDRSGGRALLVNGERHTEVSLKDGDLLQFGEGGPLVRFRLVSNGDGDRKSWREIVSDCRDIVVRRPHPRYLSTVYLLRHLLTDVARYGSPAAKLLAAFALLAPILVITVLGTLLYRQHLAAGEAERHVAELVRQLEAGRLTRAELSRRIEDERRSVADMRRRHEELMAALAASLKQQAARPREELQAIRRQLSALEQAQRFAEAVVARYGNGVGLLQGGYGFHERGTGRPLRYQGFDEAGSPSLDEKGNPLVTVEGAGPPIIIYYAGSGFLLDPSGIILTNRHLTRMWEHYEPAQQAIGAGFEPHLYTLRIFFPGHPEPYGLIPVAVSETNDVALLRTDRPPDGLPTLPLAASDDGPRVGEPLVVLSYPGTFDSLMGRLPRPVTEAVVKEAGGDPLTLADALAKRGLIRPLATQGHVSDIAEDTLTFEAGAASGSSGGPVIDQRNQVVAINYAALRKVGGVNVGLRIKHARHLLTQLPMPRDPEAAGRTPVRP